MSNQSDVINEVLRLEKRIESLEDKLKSTLSLIEDLVCSIPEETVFNFPTRDCLQKEVKSIMICQTK